MSSETLILILVNVLAIAAVGYFLLGQIKKTRPENAEDEQRALFKSLVNEVFGEVTGKITEQSKRILAGEKEIISTDLKNKQEQIEKVVGELRRELGARQQELQRLEEDRHKQFSEISTRIKEHQEITKDLQGATEKLRSALSSNQTRGQLGEFMLDKILNAAGLVENVHYSKQRHLTKTLKPDITLLLPENRVVAVDVKFPYSAVQRMIDANSKADKEAAQRDFVKDVRAKVREVKQYVQPEAGTLDFALLFVPNELVFSYINQSVPEAVNEAMESGVAIVSPFTFLVVARMVLESYRNFSIEKNLREIINYVDEFAKEWERFEEEFSKFDVDITKLRASYEKISSTRYSRMKLRISRIEDYRKGMLPKAEAQNLLPEIDG